MKYVVVWNYSGNTRHRVMPFSQPIQSYTREAAERRAKKASLDEPDAYFMVMDEDAEVRATFHHGKRQMRRLGGPGRRKNASSKKFKTAGGFGVYDLTYRTIQAVYSSEAKARKVLANFRKMNPERKFTLRRVATKTVGWREASHVQLGRLLKVGTPSEKALAKKELARRRRGYKNWAAGIPSRRDVSRSDLKHLSGSALLKLLRQAMRKGDEDLAEAIGKELDRRSKF